MFGIPTLSLPIQWQLGIDKMTNYLQKHMYMHTSWKSLVENKAHNFVLGYPVCKSMSDKFAPLFENVVLRSLKSFFQLKDQVDIRLYLTDSQATTLRHSNELVGLKCTVSPISIRFISFLNNFLRL